jgi:hypothetical protein
LPRIRVLLVFQQPFAETFKLIPDCFQLGRSKFQRVLTSFRVGAKAGLFSPSLLITQKNLEKPSFEKVFENNFCEKHKSIDFMRFSPIKYFVKT